MIGIVIALCVAVVALAVCLYRVHRALNAVKESGWKVSGWGTDTAMRLNALCKYLKLRQVREWGGDLRYGIEPIRTTKRTAKKPATKKPTTKGRR